MITATADNGIARGAWPVDWSAETHCGACGRRFLPGEEKVPITDGKYWCATCASEWVDQKSRQLEKVETE